MSTTTLNGHSFAEPDALWFALWDKNDNLAGAPFLPSGRWQSDRVKQYAGNRTKKIGGYTLNMTPTGSAAPYRAPVIPDREPWPAGTARPNASGFKAKRLSVGSASGCAV